MRVKTPWVDALAQSREQQAEPAENEAPPKPDLTPKRMSDSYFSGVSRRGKKMKELMGEGVLMGLDRFSRWLRISGCWIPISMLRAAFGMCCSKSNEKKIIDANKLIDLARSSWIWMPWPV
jgi:hypothetical protein